MSDYHSLHALSSGRLRAFATSPWHARNMRNDPTPSKMVGSVIHAAVLEPDTLDATIAYIAQEAKDAGKRPLSAKALADAIKRADEIRDDVWALVGPAQYVEQSITWTMEGVRCKAKPDIIGIRTQTGRTLYDFKATKDADPHGFRNAIARYKYHLQHAWYDLGCQACGIAIDQWAWVAVSPKIGDPPPARYPLADADRARSLIEIRALFDRYRTCTDWTTGWSRVLNVAGWGWDDSPFGGVVDAAELDQEDDDE